MLHLIFQSPLESATLQRIGAEDAVLFLENAVLHLLKNNNSHAILNTMSAFVLLSDIETRGIAAQQLMDGIVVIDYAGWVTLTTQHPRVQSWF